MLLYEDDALRFVHVNTFRISTEKSAKALDYSAIFLSLSISFLPTFFLF